MIQEDQKVFDLEVVGRPRREIDAQSPLDLIPEELSVLLEALLNIRKGLRLAPIFSRTSPSESRFQRKDRFSAGVRRVGRVLVPPNDRVIIE